MIRLFAITDSERFPSFLEQSADLCRLARPGTVAVVVRERRVTARRVLEWAVELRSVSAKWGQKLYVADRVDVAVLSGADGVHLPAAGLPPHRVDRRLCVSRAGHELDALSDEDWARIDALWISPAFDPRKGRPALGEKGLRERIEDVARRAPHVRTYALGGVGPSQVKMSTGAGACGVAAIGAVWREGTSPVALLEHLGIHR